MSQPLILKKYLLESIAILIMGFLFKNAGDTKENGNEGI
jgi:hypothetical protein